MSERARSILRSTLLGIAGVLALVAIWELYKFLGPQEGVVIGSVEGETGSGVMILPRTNDRAMPHVWEMVARLGQSASGGNTPPLIVPVVTAALTTLGIAAVGWIIGVAVGIVLGVVMQRWRLAEWGLLPWIVVSQTVPLIAFAPVVNSIGLQIDRGGTPWPQWLSVAVIASYLAFFPVAVGVLRGLESPDSIHRDLMRTYAAGYWQTLFRLRFPAAVPHLLPALRLAAASAVVGAVVAEVSIGMRGGIGRMLIQLAGQGSSDPAAPWGPVFGAIALGLVAVGSVAIVGLGLKNYRRGEATA
ncbi:NitT/TauT family transport system permease protein [Microbacteriaceae bacterium SG_E_30_P1]|uniref:NitT/TauT family transport system permease protein n=1 Tax=Antiquaquibacter oligotrophicus TaxID=2880260 RepID=A0ABT6KN75_9MICO|nr:ABC transporter permease subunit [Antiquaquibacter oligotrophicus]MDH6181461.1 NitT/TauT family transport system permease protein [Antiquaquibacter oligotrophicus]UDF12848.1 ABC transporter permease subunit [Antiquaquibacter oligotrophicus]